MLRFRLALAIVVAAAAATSSAAAEEEKDPRVLVNEALAAMPPDADGKALEAASKSLHGLGGAAVPVLVETLWMDTRPAALAKTAPRRGASSALIVLPEAHREAILRALARHGSSVVRPALALDKVAEMTPARRVAVVTTLGVLDDGAALADLLRVASAPYRTHVDPATAAPMADATRIALVRRLRQRPADVQAVSGRWNSLPRTARSAAIVAAAAAPHDETWRFLAEVVLRDVDLRGEALTALLDAPPTPESEAAEQAAAAARFEIADPNSLHRATAARLLGRIRDEASIPALVALCVSAADYEVRSAASALREITGLSLGDDAGSWERWLAREDEWFEKRGPEALEAVADGDVQRIVPALHEIAERRTRRRRLAEAVTQALHHSQASVRVIACLTLERLGVSSVAEEVRPLVVRDPDEEVRRAAARCLSAIEPPGSAKDGESATATEPLKSALPGSR